MIGGWNYLVAPIWRDNVQVMCQAAGGRVCGRAKFVYCAESASLFSAWVAYLTFLTQLITRPAVGALPQAPQGTLSLDPARGIAP